MAKLHILLVHPPGRDSTGICGGFVLISDDGHSIKIAFRRDWELYLDDELDIQVFNLMEETLVDVAAHTNIEGFVDHIEKTYSNIIRSFDCFTLHTGLPLDEHAQILRCGLLGQSIPAIN